MTAQGAKPQPGWGHDPEEEEGWNWRKFIIASTNDHDHSEVFNFPRTMKAPAALMAQVRHWVESPDTPYRSHADLFRDALIHRLAFLAQEYRTGMDFENANNLYLLEVQIAEDRQFEREMAKTIETVEERAQELAKRGDVMGLERLYAQASSIKVDPMWREKWQQRIADMRTTIERFIPDDIGAIDT